METTHDITADIAALGRDLRRGEIAAEFIGKALPMLADGRPDDALTLLMAYAERHGWLWSE